MSQEYICLIKQCVYEHYPTVPGRPCGDNFLKTNWWWWWLWWYCHLVVTLETFKRTYSWVNSRLLMIFKNLTHLYGSLSWDSAGIWHIFPVFLSYSRKNCSLVAKWMGSYPSGSDKTRVEDKIPVLAHDARRGTQSWIPVHWLCVNTIKDKTTWHKNYPTRTYMLVWHLVKKYWKEYSALLNILLQSLA